MKKWFKHDSFKQQHLLATKAKIRRSDRNFCHSARLKSATFEQALKIVTNLLGFYQLFRYFWGARGGRNFWPIDDFWPMMSYESSHAIICIYDISIWKYDQNSENVPQLYGEFNDENLTILKAVCTLMMCQMCAHTPDVPFGIWYANFKYFSFFWCVKRIFAIETRRVMTSQSYMDTICGTSLISR